MDLKESNNKQHSRGGEQPPRREKEMTYYYRTKSKGRCGCSSMTWHKDDRFETKRQLKNAFRFFTNTTITEIRTLEQMQTTYPNDWERFIKEAY